MTIGVIGILVSVLLLVFSPATQLNKARDGKKRTTFDELKGSLDAYYHDNNCYPVQTTMDTYWGANFEIGTTVYMKKLPATSGSPTSTPPGNGPFYFVNTLDTCPQWYVLTWKKDYAPPGTSTGRDCSLDAVCGGATYPTLKDDNYLCVSSGEVVCGDIPHL